MLDSRPLRMFHEVVRAGSYSAAAQAMGYTQPAISQQMRALERTVGVPLFTRQGRRLRLTQAGEVLASHAQDVLAGLEAAEEQLAAIRALTAGRVRVCTFPSASATIVAAAVADLKKTHPGIEVSLTEAEPPESLRLLQEGKCDVTLAFNYGQPSSGDDAAHLTRTALIDDELVVVLPVEHPLANQGAVNLADLADEVWIAGCPQCRTSFDQACVRVGFEPKIAFTTDDNLAMQSLVVAGVGIAVMPSLVLAFLRHPDLVAHPLRPATLRAVSAYTLPDYVRIPATASMLTALQRAVQPPHPAGPGVPARTAWSPRG